MSSRLLEWRSIGKDSTITARSYCIYLGCLVFAHVRLSPPRLSRCSHLQRPHPHPAIELRYSCHSPSNTLFAHINTQAHTHGLDLEIEMRLLDRACAKMRPNPFIGRWPGGTKDAIGRADDRIFAKRTTRSSINSIDSRPRIKRNGHHH